MAQMNRALGSPTAFRENVNIRHFLSDGMGCESISLATYSCTRLRAASSTSFERQTKPNCGAVFRPITRTQLAFACLKMSLLLSATDGSLHPPHHSPTRLLLRIRVPHPAHPSTQPPTMGCSQSTPVQERTVAAPPSNAPPAAVGSKSVPASQSAAPPSYNTSAVAVVIATDSAPTDSAPNTKTIFAINGVAITEQGIVYYHVDAADGSGSLKKRYNDFKQLYAKLPNSPLLPPLPPANIRTLFRGKHNPAMLKEREEQLAVVLNAIGNNAALASTEAFQDFLKV
ncbi:hypothetical protein PybrP1_009465 [[Pythium] brassicae (nom. inval.)]|nr:hypothetical protein PybrP1_009465 [[Pythium] brassicae (nom. inval.)]